MSVYTGLVVVAVLGGLGLLISRRRKHKRTASGSGQAGAEPPVPTFRVVTLGLQGSGKTMLLTSIYRRLQTPGDRGFYLRAPYAQLIELNRWYQEAASSGEDWPRGTSRGEMREFDFSVMTHLGDAVETIVKLGYLEYPGELLTDPDAAGATAQQRLLEAIDNADALIGIIDGFRVLQAYRGDQRGRLILQNTLDAMINAMLSARTPIAFVITKWDLLDEVHPDENTRLHIVRTMLMGIEGFRDLIAVHSAKRIIRLIPATAVGHDFAVLDGGEVRKKPAGRFEPSNVDIALSAVVPDILRQIELTLDHATRSQLLAEAQRRMRMGPAEAVQSLAGFLADRAGRMLVSAVGGGLLGDAGLTLFLDTRGDQAAHASRLATLTEADRRAESLVQARRRVVRELEHQVTLLEAKLPASRLRAEELS
jgi:hypothetical protein